MALPTDRGVGLLLVALGTYLAARVLGTWELYLLAFSFLATLLVSWSLVTLTARRLTVTRSHARQHPMAGDRVLFTFVARNGSLLPGLQVALHGPTGDIGGEERGVEFETLGPRGERRATAGPWRVRRGVHRLPPLVADAEDPLGLMRSRRTLSGPGELVVYPRLAELPACGLLAGSGQRRDLGRHGRLTLGATELRGIRPHRPGEPLSRVDWKSTARTGSLMLREMEDPTSSDVAVLLDGTAAYVVGDDPFTSYELALQAAGAIADFALRRGREVTLLQHERDWRENLLAPDAEGHRRLLDALARARPDAPIRLGPALRVMLRGSAARRPWRSLIVVALALDDELVRALAGLRKEGLDVGVAYADAASFTGVSPAGSEPLAMALLSAGVPCISLQRTVDLRIPLTAGLSEAVMTPA